MISNPTTRHEIPKEGFKGLIQNWRADLLAAISVSLVALPLALGVAVASGVKPIAGLISAIIGGVVVTLYRGSHLAINGPAAGLIAVILSALASLDDGSGNAFNYVLAATVVAGGIQVLLGVFRLGFIAESIPSSVITGVMVAIGVIIFTSQIYVATGIDSIQGNTIEKLTNILQYLKFWEWKLDWEYWNMLNPYAVIISVVGILMLIILPKLQSRLFHFLPASLWVLFASIPLVYLFNFLKSHDLSIFGKPFDSGSKFLIEMPSDLSNMLMYPDFSMAHTLEFWIAVISISLIASMQTLAMAKAVDKLDPYKRKTQLNKDLIGIGIGTMVCGAIGGLPIITVVVRSTVNITNHAKTKWSNFYHGLLLIVFLFLLTPVIQMIPYAALAAILVYIGFRLASPSVFKKIYNEGLEQLLFMLVTLIITLYTNLLWGIIGGTLFTLLVQILLARLPISKFFSLSANSDTSMMIDKEGVHNIKVKGVANFLSIHKFMSLVKDIPSGKNLHIDLSDTRLVGLTYQDNLFEFVDNYRGDGGTVSISGIDNHVSSSNNRKALKISLDNKQLKLSPRQTRLQTLAQENNYTFDTLPNQDTQDLRRFKFFELRPIERKSKVLSGRFESTDNDWDIADVVFNEGASFTSEVFYSTLMTIKINNEIPKFMMEKEGFVEKLFDRVMAFTGYKDIDFKMYTKFSNQFLLMGDDEDLIRAFFTPRLITFFEEESIFHVESNGHNLLIFSKIKLARTDETQNLLAFGERLIQELTIVYNENKEVV